MFWDTAQYFHSKHLKSCPKHHKKHFLQSTGVSGPKRYVHEFIASWQGGTIIQRAQNSKITFSIGLLFCILVVD